jgi:hypothetical protein
MCQFTLLVVNPQSSSCTKVYFAYIITILKCLRHAFSDTVIQLLMPLLAKLACLALLEHYILIFLLIFIL